MEIGERIQAWKENHTKIPDGNYVLRCVHAGKFKYHSVIKIVLFFEVFESGEFEGKLIPMFFTLPSNGKIPQGSKYFKYWVMVNGWKRPERNRLKEMPISRFFGPGFNGVVVTVKKDSAGEDQNEIFHYSKIESLTLLLEDTF